MKNWAKTFCWLCVAHPEVPRVKTAEASMQLELARGMATMRPLWSRSAPPLSPNPTPMLKDDRLMGSGPVRDRRRPTDMAPEAIEGDPAAIAAAEGEEPPSVLAAPVAGGDEEAVDEEEELEVRTWCLI